MKKFFKFFAFAAIMALVTSCGSSHTATAPVMAIGSNNIITNVKADLDYDHVQKISGEATINRVLWIFKHTPKGGAQLSANNKYKGLNATQSTALYRAKTAAGVDVILEPEFTTETKSYFLGIFKKTKVKCTGWGVNIKGFQDGTPAENICVEYNSGLFK